MRRSVSAYAAVCTAVFLCLVAGCSHNSSPTAPAGFQLPPASGIDLDKLPATTAPGHHMLGAYSLSFDIANESVDLTPNRELMAHYNVTPFLLPPYCGDCLVIKVIDYFPDDSQLEVEVKLKNPFQFTGYDVRGIFLTEQEGWRVPNAQGYTSIFDDGGQITINPFRVFSQSGNYGKMPPGSHAQSYYTVRVPPDPEYENIVFIVDASWPGHCEDVWWVEPYNANEIQTVPITGCELSFEVQAKDWQEDILSLSFDASKIAAGIVEFEYYQNDKWKVSFFSPGASGGAEPGLHRLLVTAVSNSPHATYTYLDVFVNPLPSPKDVTPEWLNFGTHEFAYDHGRLIAIRENYALDIFDASDPLNVRYACFKQIQFEQPEFGLQDIEIMGDRAYVTDFFAGLVVIDIGNILEPVILGTVPGINFNSLTASDDYLFLYDDAYSKILVLDPSVSQIPEIVGELELTGGVHSMTARGDYLYYHCDGLLNVASIADPSNPFVIAQTDEHAGYNEGLDVMGDCLFGYGNNFQDDFGLLSAVNVANPHLPTIEATLELPFNIYGMYLCGSYAYLSTGNNTIAILDISQPGDIEVVDEINTEGSPMDLIEGDGILYIAEEYPAGMSLFSLNYPQTPMPIKKFDKLFCPHVLALQDEYIYVQDERNFVKVVRLNPPERARIVAKIEIPGPYDSGMLMSIANDVGCILRGYWEEPDKVFILDLQVPEQAFIATVIDNLPYDLICETAVDGYAYAGSSQGFVVIDIDPPSGAHVVSYVDHPSSLERIVWLEDRLYVAYDSGIAAFDVTLPESPQAIGDMELPYMDYAGIAARKGYVYITTHMGSHLYMINVQDPEAMEIEAELSNSFTQGQIHIMGGFLFTAHGGGVAIFNIFPPGSIEQVFNIDVTPMHRAYYVTCLNGYTYISSANGLRIYKWW